jgi:hypothetical protein
LNTADPEIRTNPHFADYVLEVPLKNGSVEWVILHIEAQGRGGGNLGQGGGRRAGALHIE